MENGTSLKKETHSNQSCCALLVLLTDICVFIPEQRGSQALVETRDAFLLQ